jgi:hypothetical protein
MLKKKVPTGVRVGAEGRKMCPIDLLGIPTGFTHVSLLYI